MAHARFLHQEPGKALRVCVAGQDPSGASSIEWFDRWARTRDPRFRQRLLAYNEDDCRAMRVVMDRLKTLPFQPD